MYARLQSSSAPPSTPVQEQFGRFADTLAGHPGFAGLYAFQEDGGERATLLTLWQTEEDARRASERTAAQLGPRPVELDTDEVYEVEDDWYGPDRDRPAGAGFLISFDGPVSQEHAAAIRFASRQRIAPHMADFPGAVRTVALWQPTTRAMIVVSLATSRESLDASQQAILGLDLLPEEDRALLLDPDRVTAQRVVGQRLGSTQGARS